LITFAIWRIQLLVASCRLPDPATGNRQPATLMLAGIALGIATLIKGPMAPVIAIVFFALECWRLHRVPRAKYIPGVAAMVVIPLLWFIPAMTLGGGAYTHEVLQKQLAGRAIGAWVHQSPPWFYLLHSPGFLFPWFAALVAALIARWREERLNINWILAVLIPYSLMSSKLDVYMMALVPPVAIIVANAVDRTRLANVITMAVLLLAAIVAPFFIHEYTTVFIALGIASAIALVLSLLGGDALRSAIVLGLVPIAVLLYVAITQMPLVNDLATPRPLIAALEKQHVPGQDIALYTCPHLWAHDMPRDLENVHYVLTPNATVIATARAHAKEIAPQLAGYHVVNSVKMIGKWFDVYRR
ncbi:MAG TPA: hypothetical protein VGJ81_22695, partial [Thermoanaerobaculia bacterium]